jgi:hypothetical protein
MPGSQSTIPASIWNSFDESTKKYYANLSQEDWDTYCIAAWKLLRPPENLNRNGGDSMGEGKPQSN